MLSESWSVNEEDKDTAARELWINTLAYFPPTFLSADEDEI